jgi:hypothetical protein
MKNDSLMRGMIPHSWPYQWTCSFFLQK